MRPRLLTVPLLALGVAAALAAAAAAQSPLGVDREMVAADLGALLGVADFDGDGDLDLCSAWSGVFLNDGHARFATQQVLSFFSSFVGLAIADFNGDGLADVIGGTGGATIAAWVGMGGGALVDLSGVLPALPGSQPISCLAHGDVDGDGDQDLVIGRVGAPLVLWLNLGPLQFVDASSQLPSGAFNPRQMKLLDMDGDGDCDLLISATAGPFASAIRTILSNAGTGVFTTAAPVLGPGSPTESFITGDVNGDSLPDIAFFAGSGLQLLVSGGPGGGFSSTTLAANWFVTPVFADVTADGSDELIIASTLTGIEVRSVLPGPVIAPPLQTMALFQSGSPMAADLDGDGDRDLIMPTANATRVLLNTGQGLREIPGRLATPSMSASPMQAGDLDGDGDADLIGMWLGGIVVARNDGNGQLDWDATMTCAGQCPSSSANNAPFRPIDADGDGDLDLYLVNAAAGSLPPGDRLLLNNGPGFTATIAVPTGSTLTSALGIGDVDGDGDQDVVVARSGYTGSALPTQVLFNSGTGAFGAQASLPIASPTWDLALVDVDGDGDLDLVEANGSQGAVLLNSGFGTFSLGPALPVSTAYEVAAGDLDGDGDTDLIVSGQVLINGGSGTFTPGASIALVTNHPLALIDADADGDLDVFQGGVLHLNSGAATFTSFLLTTVGMTWAAVADFDRDGDQDLVTPSGYSEAPHLFCGLARQLSRGNPARPGRPASFDLRGPSLGAWTLFVSTGPAAIPAPPFGTVWIDPAPAIALGSGTFDFGGRGSWSTLVPPSPSFVGQSFFLQAVVSGGSVPKLTGREVVTVATY